MTYTFNLIDEQWIPCETLEGGVIALSLRDTLTRAHVMRSICGETPIETAALYRLLLTVLHRVFGPADTDAWFSLWRQGRWDAAQLDAYWEAWYDRFDLLHPDENRRFYQRKPLEGKSAPMIHVVYSGGNNPALFSHITDANHTGMTPAEAARALITAQAFRPGGIIKPPISGTDGPASRGISLLLEGRSLFETTVLNLWAYLDRNFEQISGIPQTEHDAPAWEQNNVFEPRRDLPLGYLDYLTWQGYSFWLEGPDTDGLIRETQIGLGQLKPADTICDPFKHHRANKKQGYSPLRFREDRLLWRDSTAILEQAGIQETQASKRPYCITWFDTLFAEDEDDLGDFEALPLLALGMEGDKAKVEFYRQERLPIPALYLRERHLVGLLKSEMERAEQIRSALWSAVYRLAERIIAPDAGESEGRKPRGEDVRPLVAHWGIEREYWANIEPAFWQLINDLPHRTREAQVKWSTALARAARNAYTSAENLAGNDARALKAAAAGRASLEYFLAPHTKGD